MIKCNGCGSFLQNTEPNMDGYTKDIKNSLCERCFKIANYNEYKMLPKNNSEFISILDNINKTNDLVVLVVDLLNISSSLELIRQHIKNDILLVLSKRDLLPKDIYEEKLLNYININTIDRLIISSKTNYNLDSLMDKIYKYKKTKNVYFVGITNAGKSSLINKIIYNYSKLERFITTSNLPSTTLNTIEIELNDSLTLIDTPGIIDEANIINYVSDKDIKKIIPKNQIKPITFQIKNKQSVVIEDYLRIDIDNNNITLFMSSLLNIKRLYNNCNLLEEYDKKVIEVRPKTDIVITGLGFIKVTKKSTITLYTPRGVEVYIRNSLI